MRSSCVVILFWASVSCALAQEIPAGFEIGRYTHLWERNPFAPVTQAALETRRSFVDNLYLTSWLKDGSREVVFVQSSDTNESQRITAEPNQNNLRLVEMRLNPTSRFGEAIISDGKEQGTVKFKSDIQSLSEQSAFAIAPGRNHGVSGKTSKSGEAVVQASTRTLPPTAPANKVFTSRYHPGIARVRKEGDPE
jgi:hypothetical protein